MSSRPLRSRRLPEEAPNRSSSNRGDNPAPRRTGSNRGDNPASSRGSDGPTRGVTRNKSLPMRRPAGDDDKPKRRQGTGRKEPSARGVNRVRSGGFAVKGRRAPSERTTSSGSNIAGTSSSGRTGTRTIPPESPGMAARPRKVATPVVGSVRTPSERSRGTARTSDPNKVRSKSADASKKLAARRANRETNNSNHDVPPPSRMGRRTPSGGNVMQPPSAPMASPGAAGRKIRRAAPEKRGIAPSKSLPSEQIRRVERIRQGQNKQAAGYYRAPSRRKQDSSSEEESSDEESSSSESSIEPTESHRDGDDFHDSDYDSDADVIKPPKNEEQQDGLHYSGEFDFDDVDDDVSFGPPPQVGGRVVYPGGIVVEDASDSECEWEHGQPSRNRIPDIRNGDDWLQPVATSYGSGGSSKRSSAKKTSSSASTQSSSKKKSSRRPSSEPERKSSKRSSNKKSSRSGGGTGKVRRPEAARQTSDSGGRPVQRKPRTGRRSRSSSNERPLYEAGGGSRPRSRSSSDDSPLYEGATRQSRGENQRKGRHSPMRTHSDDDVVDNRTERVGSGRKQARPVRRGTGDQRRGGY